MKSFLCILLLGSLCVNTVGCRLYSRHRILSVWGDWNTYEQPAFVVDGKNHLPYRGPEVAYFNWMYGMKTYKPLQKKKYRQRHDDACPPVDGVPMFLGMPLFPSGRVSSQAEKSPQPIPENSSERERDASPADPSTDTPSPSYVPIQHEEADDELSFDVYPPGDLKSISGSGPVSPATE